MLGSRRLARASAALFMTAIVGGAVAPGGVASADRGSTIEAQDSCDAASFNAVLGPGACNPRAGGEVTFGAFVAALAAANPAEVLRERDFLDWTFDENSVSIGAGQDLRIRNEGGETHSFTEVTAFGPGCVPPLNAPFFGFVVADICNNPTAAFGASFIPSGGTHIVAGLSAGTHLFQCFIHPWMRADVTVGARHGRDD